MKILVLGGTVFVGRHIVEAALARGHEVTMFNRGEHSPDLFPTVEKLRGNRDGDLTALAGRTWDAAIDTCGYVPRIVAASAQLLANGVKHYTFISSVSAFKDFSTPSMDENGPLGTMPDPGVEEVTGETYGPLKVLCEAAAEATMPGRVLIVRPGLIVGPHDPTDRFTYWPRRVAAGGEVLAPGKPEQQVQFIDVRDLASWTIKLVEANQTGIYNATGPDYPLTMGQVLETCQQVSQSHAHLTWVDEKLLIDEKVGAWSELPLWVPDSDPKYVGFAKVNCQKAIAAGLTFMPLADTVRDTLEWDATRSAEVKANPKAGLKPEREAELLAAYHQTQA